MQQRPTGMEMFVVRIGDDEREVVLNALGEHHARGRLSVEELDRRQHAALAAVTQADLAALLADLPDSDHRLSPAVARKSSPRSWTPEQRKGFVNVAKRAGPPVAILTGAAYMTSVGPFYEDPAQFITATAMGALGFVSHWLASYRRK